ncbi:hypothetical protein [Catenulispora pinisilvae]|uniref:hypothetical protein n=1 Tax=Catenulispora pinisilvae TaxID=2705253 RepID=UPI0018915E12|nr:hypothetical protein [Catenulispora pinisilvae]
MSAVSAVKAAGTVGGLGSAAAMVATAGWPGMAMVVVLIAMSLAAMLWILNSMARSRRLILVITAVRGNTRAAAQRPELPARPETLVPGSAEREEPDPIARL